MLILGVDANAKLSSNKIEKQKDKIQNIIDVCQFDDSVLKEIQGKTTGSIVTSSIATAASGVSTAASVGALVIGKNKDASSLSSEDNAKLKTHRVASAIGSGIATGANLVTVTLSGPSLKKIKEQIEISEDCKEAIAELDKNALMSTK